jgi:transcriptional regulator NrdR family protein
MMICPICRGKTKVTDSVSDNAGAVNRARRCDTCKATMLTTERVTSVDRDGEKLRVR